MTACARCNGSGIIGSGPEPWLHLGAKKTCPDCNGTGVLADAGAPIGPANQANESQTDDAGNTIDTSMGAQGTNL